MEKDIETDYFLQPVLLQLQQKAHAVYQQCLSGKCVNEDGSVRPMSEEDQDSIGGMLNGRTRVVEKKKKASSTSPKTPVLSTDFELRDKSSSPWPLGGMADVHPNLLEHLKSVHEPQHQYNPSVVDPAMWTGFPIGIEPQPTLFPSTTFTGPSPQFSNFPLAFGAGYGGAHDVVGDAMWNVGKCCPTNLFLTKTRTD